MLRVKKFLKMTICKNLVNIIEKILDFNKRQKSKRTKILTPKPMLQRLPIALA